MIAPRQSVMQEDVTKDKIMILKNGEVAAHEAEASLKEHL